MRFHRLDLNLLVVLDTLIAERNVSRTAARLNLTQPAISNSLAKLRQHFDDELLVKLGRQMVPTPLAETLREPIRETLMNIQAIAESRPSFDPSTVEKEFTIVASDYVAVVYLTEALRRVEAIAPGVSFHILPVTEHNNSRLNRGDADLMIVPEATMAREHPRRLLFEDRFTCLAWSQNRTVKSPLSLDDYLAAKHVVTSIDGDPSLVIDEAFLHLKGHRREVVAVTPSFTLLPYFLVGTRHLATLHERLAKMYAGNMALKVVTPDISFPPLREHLQWHRNRENDPANRWLREFLIDIAGSI